MTDDRQEVSPEQFEMIKAALGIEAEQFKRTKLGQYIFDRIEREELELIEQLIATDPDDAKANRDIRNEIYKRRVLPLFIDEAIRAGWAAERNIDAMEAAESGY